MDLSTIIGLVVGLFILYNALSSGGSSIMTYWDWPSFQITVGGTIFATMINYPLDKILSAGKIAKNIFVSKTAKPAEVIATLVSFAEKARREGLLALEDDANKLEDPFLQKGISLVVDGTDPELVRSILETELAFLEDRHAAGASLFEVMGTLAPAWGMLGTIIGLIAMLKNLKDSAAIGSGMALALITTLYGSFLANFFFLPIAGKLKLRSAEEVLIKEVMVEGILSIQAGDNPRIVEEKLKAFLAPKLRQSVQRKGRGAGSDEVEENAANG